jgi:hypothetical protein
MCGPSAAKQGAERGGHERLDQTKNTKRTQPKDIERAMAIAKDFK